MRTMKPREEKELYNRRSQEENGQQLGPYLQMKP
jgi:hypothetical protein